MLYSCTSMATVGVIKPRPRGGKVEKGLMTMPVCLSVTNIDA